MPRWYGYESRKNQVYDTWLNPKYLQNWQPAAIL